MRILIVDDNTLGAELTAECLMLDFDVHVEVASEGATALSIGGKFSPEVVLLDVHLPDVSGLDLAPRIKAMCPTARIVIFSGSAREPADRILPPGVDDWLAKPANLEKLGACIFRTGAKKGLTD